MTNSNKSQSITFPCIKITQPIGEFFIASIDSQLLYTMTYTDIRKIEGRDIEKYLGIQRPLDPNRVTTLKQYVKTIDACFPTGVIIAVEGLCCHFDEKTNQMTLSEYKDPDDEKNNIPFEKIGKILDGQHRLEGLLGYKGPKFEINVSIFVDIDLSNQAYIFSTVNLAQTKVNKSLAYDLFDLAKARSPQKTCHLIAVGLDTQEKSPFYKRIKRLGVATEGRFDEKITQANFIEKLLPYISNSPDVDRDLYLRGKKPPLINADESLKLIFRNMFIQDKDLDIAEIIINFFNAIKTKWPTAWESSGKGDILNRTNGLRALMRFLKPAYLYISRPGLIPTKDQFLKVFNKVDFKDSDFNVDNFPPGTSGESKLYNALIEKSGVNLASKD